MEGLVVYTAITRDYDPLREPPQQWKGQANFVAFLERPVVTTDWIVRPIYHRFKDPCRNAKIHKILSHSYFQNTEYSLWLDGSIVVTTQEPLYGLVEMFLRNHDIVVFRHHKRNCVFQEAVACIKGELDKPATIHRQMQRYFDQGYPTDNGLAECSVILRRHTAKIRRFNESWYAEIRSNSRRDQLSFNYVAYKLGIRYGTFPGTLLENSYFLRQKHAGLPFRPC